MDKINFQGKTDPLILKEALGESITESASYSEKIERLKEKYFTYLKENMPNYEAVILPGIEELLKKIDSHPSTITGLLTGNFMESAKIKLEQLDLYKYFSFGVYGDNAASRNGLPDVAKKILLTQFGHDLSPRDMIIIGDTVHDIECAKHAGAVSVAVATGWTRRDVLIAHRPDYYFDDFQDFTAFLRII